MHTSLASFLLILLAAKSCDEKPVRFAEPQPTGQSDLKSIPKKYIGKYSDASDPKTTLEVTGQSVFELTAYSDTVYLPTLTEKERLEIDSVLSRFEDPGKINLIETNDGDLAVQVRSDSLFIRTTDGRTWFRSGRGTHVR